MNRNSITTTAGEEFSGDQHAELALLVYIRWGRAVGAAHSAWKRLFQNNCSLRSFDALLQQGLKNKLISSMYGG